MVHLRVRRWSRVAPPCCAPGAVADFLFLNSLLLAVLGQFVGFVGATVTGIGLRRRKRELEVLNKTLLSVNAELRTAQRRDRRAGRVRVNTTKEGAVDAEAEGARYKVVDRLREGKRLLRESRESGTDDAAERALGVFLAVLDDVRNDKATQESLDSAWKAERKARRGAAVALRKLGRSDEAEMHWREVLSMSVANEDAAVAVDVLGALADCETDKGDLEAAGKYYDKYLVALTSDDADALQAARDALASLTLAAA